MLVVWFVVVVEGIDLQLVEVDSIVGGLDDVVYFGFGQVQFEDWIGYVLWVWQLVVCFGFFWQVEVVVGDIGVGGVE